MIAGTHRTAPRFRHIRTKALVTIMVSPEAVLAIERGRECVSHPKAIQPGDQSRIQCLCGGGAHLWTWMLDVGCFPSVQGFQRPGDDKKSEAGLPPEPRWIKAR